MLPEQQQRIMGYFIEEAKDHLNTIEQGLLNLQTTIQDAEKANELFRAAHSVKGGAAMLGLESIQRTAHRMEDYFKVLKESPVRVDRALETMFLRISDGLKDLLEQLEGPFGLTPDRAQEIMADVEPVFGQLETHLKSLVDNSNDAASGTDELVATPANTSDALQTSFKRDVGTLLRQLLAAFKRDDNLESRKALQNTCEEMISVGKQFELTAWCDLVETARIAVSELSNDYRTLAPILIKEIKKAQDLVLTGRASEVAVSDAMQALLPEDLLSVGTLPSPIEGMALPTIPSSSTEEENDFKPLDKADDETSNDELADLFGGSDDENLDDSRSPEESAEESADELAGLFDSGLAEEAVEDDLLSSSAADEKTEDNELDSVNRLSVELEFDEIPSELSALNRNIDSEEKADESLDALLATVNVTGPDVGSEELNSLADLFDGDLEELDNTLGNHAFVSEEMQLNPESIDDEVEEDLADLFEAAPSEEDELTGENSEFEEDLFGGTLAGEEFATVEDSGLETDDGPSSELLEESARAISISSPETSVLDELDDVWADDDLLNELSSDTTDQSAGSITTEELEESAPDANSLDSRSTADSSDMLMEDAWAEEVLPEDIIETENNEEDSLQQTPKTSIETAFSELESSELADLELDGSLEDLDLPDINDTDDLLAEQFDTEEELSDPNWQPQIEDAVDNNQDTETPSLTEQLIIKQSLTPREQDIEFPTLTGEKLQEAEEDIDSFFVDDDTDDTRENDLSDEDPWSDLSADLSGTVIDEDSLASLEVGSSENSLEKILEESSENRFQHFETASEEVDLEAVFIDTEESSSDTILEVEEAGSELDELLEASSEAVNLSPSEDLDISSSDLWGELEATPDLQAEQTVEDLSGFSLSIEEAELIGESPSSATEATSFIEEDDSTEIAPVLDDLLSSDTLEQTPIDRRSTLEAATTNSASELSEDDLLDFDTAFGTGLAEEGNLLEETVDTENQNRETTEELDLPTFTGSLDEFADAADGETTISDIADLRLEDAELDSLLGLDFAVGVDEQIRKSSFENRVSIDSSIDDSVIEAFSDVDDLFEEELVSSPSSDERAARDISSEDLDESSFFGLLEKDSKEEINVSNSLDFDELDSLLSEGTDAMNASASTVDFPTLTPTEVAEPDDDDFDDLERLLEDGEADVGETQVRRTPTRTPRRSASVREQNMRVSVKHLDNLSNLVGELVVNRNTLERDQERLRQFLDNLLFQVQQLNDVGQRLRDLYERSLLESSLMSNKRSTAGESNAESENDHATGATFDALEMDRFTGFHSLSQEMIELIVRVRESSSDIGYTVESSDQVTRQFRQITTQLQEGLNTARMVAFSQAADRLPRAVRDISLKCGKEAQLVVEGQDTLIDKMIVEHLYDPLTHLVNNAITHGIEMPEKRTAEGKPAEGTIKVRAFYQGNQTVIYVSDDGGGINTKFVQRKAIEKGLISQAEAESLSDIETYDLLFHPGFSTRDEADDFAGRGVGMDVVRTSLAEIRGSITIDSEMGRGTSFTIRLPLTLSISKALSCVSSQARIAFPMDGVEDMLDVPRDRVVQNDRGQDCVRWRDTLLPFQPVTDLLKFNRTLGRSRVYGGSQEDDILSVIVLRSANTYVAVQVDQVIGEEEIVIKQLEGPVPKPLGIAGATVLGDGRVMPIADVLELIDIAMGRVRREPSSMMWAQEEGAVVEETPVKSEPTVLIVDDSITVRELLSMSFNKVGYRVEQARDGQEAWDKLRSGLPCDLVFCDIEMPRMDGLELLSRMQKDSQLKRVPIAMLTSRGADRHRQMAVDLGASGYFTKPYLEEALLDAAQRMLNGETLEKGRGG